MAPCRGVVRDDGDRRQCPHRLLLAVPADSRRIQVGSGRNRRSLLLRVFDLGDGDTVRRLPDRPPRHKACHRNRCCADGRRSVAGIADPRAMAALLEPWRTSRRRGQPARLYGAIALPDSLVCAAARAGAEHCLFRGRRRLRYDSSLAPNLDCQFGLADGLLVTGTPGACGTGTAQFAAQRQAGRPRSRTRRRLESADPIAEPKLRGGRLWLGRLDPWTPCARRVFGGWR
jgi:hypothetical protein